MTRAEQDRALTELVREFGDRVTRLCRAYTDSNALCDDLLQEVWINVWKALPRFREAAALSTYIYRIAVNTAISFRRREQRYQLRTQQASPALLHDTDPTIAAQTDLLHRAIRQLKERDRLLVGLLLEDLSYREMAEILGGNVNQVGVSVHRIKERLARIIHQLQQSTT